MTKNHLHPKLTKFAPELVIFDKDGTLINFHAMWGTWLTDIARKLEQATGQSFAASLFAVMDFNPKTGHIMPGGHLADSPMAELRQVTEQILQDMGVSPQISNSVMSSVWHPPDPVALAQPLADIPRLFNALRQYGASIAIATSDDHDPTEQLLTAWNVRTLVDTVICADDGYPIKPAPDVILAICEQLNISPTKTVMVGDNPADIQMGRAAGAGLTIGVLSGLSTRPNLEAESDIILASVAELVL